MNLIANTVSLKIVALIYIDVLSDILSTQTAAFAIWILPSAILSF